jgi:hypothetical protein
MLRPGYKQIYKTYVIILLHKKSYKTYVIILLHKKSIWSTTGTIQQHLTVNSTVFYEVTPCIHVEACEHCGGTWERMCEGE